MRKQPRIILSGIAAGIIVSMALTAPPAVGQTPPEEATTTAELPPEEPEAATEPNSGEPPPEEEGGEEGEAAAAVQTSDVPVPVSPWSTGLITSMAALSIGGFSAVLGIWVDRDKKRPVIFAFVMSVLITAAITVGLTQSYLDAVSAIQQKEDLNRMLNMVSEIAEASGDQELADLVTAESSN
jgi:MFS family permease